MQIHSKAAVLAPALVISFQSVMLRDVKESFSQKSSCGTSSSSSHIEEISVNNKKYHQPSSIANHLNNYFCNVASDLATSLPKSNRHFKSYLTQYKEKFSFT